MSDQLAFIGTGKMGTAIAEQLLKSGYSLKVYNRTKEKAQPLAALGASVVDSIEEAVKNTDIVMSCLFDDQAVLQISDELLKQMRKGAIHVCTSTILPKTAKHLAEMHTEVGIEYIAAPLLGLPKAVRKKAALTLCSGNQEAIEKTTPLFETYSNAVQNLGKQTAHANVLKICMNYSLISAIELISELYVFAEKSGLDTDIIRDSLKHVYAHPAFHVYIDKIHDRQFDEVNFDIKGGDKDVKLFQEAFLDVEVTPDIANMLQNKFTEAIATGMENDDWSTVSEIIRRRSGS